MKRFSLAGLVFVLVLVAAAMVLAACGDEAATDTTTVPQSTTTAMPATTTMPGGTTTTEVGTTATTMSEQTTTSTTTEDIDIPEAKPGSFTDLTPQQAQSLIETTPDLVIIDVSPHYDEGHLPGAVSYYLGDGSLEAAIPTLDKEVPYLVYCHVDSVAIAGAQALVDAGFPTVYRLQGNYSGWVEAGYPVEK